MAECIITGSSSINGEISYDEMPYTTSLFSLFEPDSLDTDNNLWHNKIIGGNDMTLIGGTVSDNALLFTANEYGYVPTDFYYSCYLVVKKPVLESNKALCGSVNYNVDKPNLQIWNNGDNKGSFFECITGDSNTNLYYTTNELENYHVISCTTIDNPNTLAKNVNYSAITYWFVDNDLLGATAFYRDVSGCTSYTNFNGVIALNTCAKGNSTNIVYNQYICLQDSYYRAFAFGGKQTFEQMQANHKYLYDKYCT